MYGGTTVMDNNTSGIEEAPAATHEEVADLDAEIAELAKLKPLEYDRVREERAKELGVRVATLDKAVEQFRREGADTEPSQGRALSLQDPEPWPDTVDGQALLNRLSAFIARHMILP